MDPDSISKKLLAAKLEAQTENKDAGTKDKFSWGYFSIVLGIMIVAIVPLALGFASYSWPTANGAIVTSNYKSTLSTGHFSGRVGSPPRIYLSYRFYVDGHPYKSNLVHLSGPLGFYNTLHVDEFATKYARGNQIAVHYDPHFHWLSVLEPGPDLEWIFVLLCGTLGLVTMLPQSQISPKP
jgi:hypothetical protein